MCQKRKWLETINALSIPPASNIHLLIVPNIEAIMMTAFGSHETARDLKFPAHTAADLFVPSFMTAGSYA